MPFTKWFTKNSQPQAAPVDREVMDVPPPAARRGALPTPTLLDRRVASLAPLRGRFAKLLAVRRLPSIATATAIAIATAREAAPSSAAARHAQRGARDDDASRERPDNPLDPAARLVASLAPIVPFAAAVTPLAPAEADAPIRGRSLEELLPALVRRIAWAGDKQRGTVRLELGAGPYAGTTVVVHAEEGRVRVELTGREGADLDHLRRRVDERLRERGLEVDCVR